MILDFNDELGPQHFEFCFVGFVFGGSIHDKKGIVVLRRELQLFEKLESISELKPCGKKMSNGEPERQLNPNGMKQIEVDAPEVDMLYNYLTIVPWATGTPTKKALNTIDWLLEESRNGRS